MNILPIDNSNSFKGTLSKKVVKHIRKAERTNILEEVHSCNYWGEVVPEEKIDAIKNVSKSLIEKLQKLAEALPKKSKICLKERGKELYIKGKHKDRYVDIDFNVFNPFANGPIGRLTSHSGGYLDWGILETESKNLLGEDTIKEYIANEIKTSIEKDIKKGKIKSSKALQRRYDYYTEEFPAVELKLIEHEKKIEDYKKQQAIIKENKRYLSLRERIWGK